ncbi:MAG: BON domain-containing protein [Cyanobacteria bacterium REEB67]|nr:BON domain-containing protein [Cyanobacteria bacterium REEB67]
MKKLVGLSALIVACVCIQQGAQANGATDSEKFAKSQETAPDNTSKNKRDKVENTMTADKAGNSKSDVELARTIRKSIMDTKGLSVNAQNVKIVVKNGNVTLRGPVDNASEKETLDSLAKSCCSGATFLDKLEVKGHNSQK